MICLVAAWSILPGTGFSVETNEEALAVAAASLGSPDFLLTTEGTRTLFSARMAAIPHLLARFEDQAEFQGLCGRRILASNSYIVGPAEMGRWLTTLVPRISVREVALYLVVAILRGDLYFADVCKPVIAPGPVINPDPWVMRSTAYARGMTKLRRTERH